MQKTMLRFTVFQRIGGTDQPDLFQFDDHRANRRQRFLLNRFRYAQGDFFRMNGEQQTASEFGNKF